MKFEIYYCFEVLAFVTACIKYKALLATRYKYFLAFLLLIVSYETASLYNKLTVNHSNLWAINIESTLEFLFYSLFIRGLLTSQVYKRVVLAAVCFSFAYGILSLFLIHGFWRLNISGIIMQNTVIILITGSYFWEQLQQPQHIALNLVKQPGFWLNTGVSFYYLGEFLFFVSFSYLAYKHNFAYLEFWTFVTNIANAILYGCLAICFLCVTRPIKPAR